MPTSNDNSSLIPATPTSSRRLEFDFPGLKIGCAEYSEGPTGCTVFLFERGWPMAIDKRGGMVGTTGDFDWAHALTFAGGSLLGLEAAAGVGAFLFASKDYSTNHIPLVNGGIIWDYVNRQNTIYPDKALGRAAAAGAVEGGVPLGRIGAGRSATLGRHGFRRNPAGRARRFASFAACESWWSRW